ncbi:MAG: hypothetical protein U1F17_06210 [Burkholderiaceae bacterium]
MLFTNPFAGLSASLSPAVMQGYVIVMFLLVVAGTLFDVVHKGSATYFFENLRRSKSKAARRVGGGELASIAVQTAVVDVLASGEFCNPRRRVAHLLGMYGFVFYVLATVVLVFNASAGLFCALVDRRPDDLRRRLLVLVLHPRRRRRRGPLAFRIVKADLFILSLLASATFALIWALAGGGAGVRCSACTSFATTVLFGRGAVVEVRAHVLQARGRLEKRLSRPTGPQRTCPRKPATTPSSRRDTRCNCCWTRRGMGLGIKARSAATLLTTDRHPGNFF